MFYEQKRSFSIIIYLLIRQVFNEYNTVPDLLQKPEADKSKCFLWNDREKGGCILTLPLLCNLKISKQIRETRRMNEKWKMTSLHDIFVFYEFI